MAKLRNVVKCKDKYWTTRLSQGKYKRCYLVRADLLSKRIGRKQNNQKKYMKK